MEVGSHLNDGHCTLRPWIGATCVRERVANERSVVVRRKTVREFLAKGSLPMICGMAPKASPGIFVRPSACRLGTGTILSEQI